MTQRYPKDDTTQLSPHFNVSEFRCPCSSCTETLVDSDLITKLEKMREKTGKLGITSGYRCEAYQSELRLRGFETAKGTSQHTLGKACDITNGVMSGAELESLAREAGFEAVGVGRTWVHVDLRAGPLRWFYAKR